MPYFELGILVTIFITSFILIRINLQVSLIVLLILSVFLHKEFFSIYRWDLLPVRIFMLAFAINSLFNCLRWILDKTISKSEKLLQLKGFFLDPFVFLISLLWLVFGISILYSENIMESVLLYGSFTTIVIFGLTFYKKYFGKVTEILTLIKTYVFLLFGLCLFGLVQLGVYLKTGFIFGALWNVPTKLPRIGATFWDVNHFGALLAATIPIVGMFVLTAYGWRRKLGYSLMLIPMVAVLLLTNSRSAWILAFVTLLSFIVIQVIRRIGFKGIYIILFVLVLISSLGFWEYSDKNSRFRAEIKDYFHYRIDSFDSHILLLQGAYQVLEMYPYFGGGYGSFYEQFSKTEVAPTFFGRDPISITSGLRAPGHSIWGELAAETGWIGLFVFILFIGTIVLSLLYISLTEKSFQNALLVSAMVSSIVGWLVAGIFYSYKAEFFWLVIFIYFVFGISNYFRQFNFKDVLTYFSQSNKAPYIIFLMLGLVLIFWGLGDHRLIPWDEAIYAKIAKNMTLSGDYINLHWNLTKIWYEKPPLAFWMMSLMMNIFGVTEFAARFPTALLGFLTVLVVYVFGKRLFSKSAGFLAGIALITTTQFLYYTRTSMLDVSVTFFITVALYYYWKTVESRETGNDVVSGISNPQMFSDPQVSSGTKVIYNKYINWILTGMFIGLGAMIKSVIGFLPFVIIFLNEIYLLITKKTKFEGLKYLTLFASTMVVFLPWHIVMYTMYGQSFIDNYFFYHILERGTSAIEDKGEPFFWYITVMKVSMRIWFIALLAALPVSIFYVFKKNLKHVLLVIAFFTILIFFSAAPTKLVWYITPIYPIAVLMIGFFGDFIMEKFKFIKGLPMKFITYYFVTMFALFYLFLVRGLVYTIDLTGPMADLLVLKEKQYGLTTPMYVDKVPLPIVMFYLDGDYKTVEYSQLERAIKKQPYNEPLAYVTKISRHERIQKLYPSVLLVKQLEEFALGFENSDYERDKFQLDIIQDQIKDLEDQITTKQVNGEVVTVDVLENLAALKVSEQMYTRSIAVGLASVSKEEL
ncbi:glycosyltransferase family 39 protein [candidate division WWE3 bacterium]|nr:glycosyltransferase family 39 protein [candidate division WWE3 bacterium]